MQNIAHAIALAAPALLALPLYLVIHLLLWQVLPQPRKGVLFLVLTAAIAYFVVLLLWPVSPWRHGFTSVPLYAFEVVLYMHLYFGFDRSLSVRMLGELVQSGEGCLTLAELNRRYSAQDMVERRVAVLAQKGMLEKRGDTYACTAKGRFLVALALAGKRLYGLRATG
jgi:hypothetical protein